MATRIELNGEVRAERGGRKRPAARERRERPAVLTAAARQAVLWSRRVTVGSVLLSCGLNGYASGRHGEQLAGQVAGAALGVAVPVLVWGLAQVTAWTYRAGWRRWALVPGAVACALLAMSVTHCALAFAALTGTGAILSACVAVGIDCGLVSSEATAILTTTVE